MIFCRSSRTLPGHELVSNAFRASELNPLIFEVAPVFRAEKHNTTRHLNEYIGLDFEMGYIDSFEDVMAMETGFLKYTMELLKSEYKKELDMLGIDLPSISQIPQVRFDEAKQLVSEKYNRKIRNPFDLEPEEEVLIGRYFKEEYDKIGRAHV